MVRTSIAEAPQWGLGWMASCPRLPRSLHGQPCTLFVSSRLSLSLFSPLSSSFSSLWCFLSDQTRRSPSVAQPSSSLLPASPLLPASSSLSSCRLCTASAACLAARPSSRSSQSSRRSSPSARPVSTFSSSASNCSVSRPAPTASFASAGVSSVCRECLRPARWPRGSRLFSSSAPSAEAFATLLRDPSPLSLETVLQILDFRLKEKQFVSFAHEHEHNHPAASVGMSPGEFVVALNRVAACVVSREARTEREAGEVEAAAQSLPGQDSVWRDIRFQRFLARLKKRLLAFKPGDLHRTLVAFSRLKYCPDDLLSSILRLLDSPPSASVSDDQHQEASPDGFAALSPQQLSQLPVLLCPLSHGASREVLQEFLRSYCRFLSSSPPSSVSVPAGTKGSGQELTSPPPARVDACSLQELSFIVLGLSTLGFRDLPFLGLLAHAVQTKVATHPLFLQLSRDSSKSRGTLGDVTHSVSLTTALLSFATLGVVHPRLYQEIFRALRGALHCLPPSQLANIALALATLTREPANPFPLTFLSALEDVVAERCMLMDGEDALTTAWAGCALNLHQGNATLFRRLLSQCVLSLASAERQGDTSAALSKQQKQQLAQIRLDLLLSPSPKTQKLREELEKDKPLWEGLHELYADGRETEAAFEEDETGEDLDAIPHAVRDAEEEVFQLLKLHPDLTAAALRGRLAVETETAETPSGDAAARRSAHPAAGPDEDERGGELLERDARLCGFYRCPVLLREKASASREEKLLSSTGGVAVLVDFTTFPDFAEPSDLFLALKHRHLRLAGYTLLVIRLSEWQALDTVTEKRDYIVSRLLP
ncbi:hypothetical protein TGGT1_273885 [Toxoplasma gondii GT1]|uniref:RAP domain-containing protein n=3 Tax=Toxoplasma gondii TaxID=5811 RepID=S7WJX1_TOXGG|nr:hypothetical protein TGGT1_273885 [Toxoplasma gondii GT1]KAF4642005.1 hypothetical protein TGRH88_078170 [Toxoplasma gondii]